MKTKSPGQLYPKAYDKSFVKRKSMMNYKYVEEILLDDDAVLETGQEQQDY